MITPYKKRIPWNKGKKMSEETKRKISESKKENPTRYWLGKKRSKETNEKIGKKLSGNISWNKGLKKQTNTGKTHFKKGSNMGEKNYNWKGGITSEYMQARNSPEMNLWREAVYIRDDFTCQNCKTRGGDLHAHHKDNFAKYTELRTTVSNGVTLCIKCHRKFHSEYSCKNNTQEQLMKFLNKKILC